MWVFKGTQETSNRLLHYKTFILLPLQLCLMQSLLLWGLSNAGITQNPRHLVRKRGQEARLRCSPMKGHSHVYWYRQLPGEGLKFMVYLQEEKNHRWVRNAKGTVFCWISQRRPQHLEDPAGRARRLSSLFLCQLTTHINAEPQPFSPQTSSRPALETAVGWEGKRVTGTVNRSALRHSASWGWK